MARNLKKSWLQSVHQILAAPRTASYGARILPFRSFLSSCRSQPHQTTILITRNAHFSQARRFYYVDRHGVQHFRKRGPEAWFHMNEEQPRRPLMIFLLIAGGTFAVIYFTHLERVPYTYRRHFVLVSPQLEMKLGEENFKTLKKQMNLKILPAIHPHSIRVRKIAKDVVGAVMEGAKAEDWGEVVLSSDVPMKYWKNSIMDLKSPEEYAQESFPSHEAFQHNDEVVDDTWVEESRKHGLEKQKKAFTQHLEGIQWEVLVVDADIVNAFCLPGGKIVVFTGLLKHFPSDEEIATVLGHEVAHVVARHPAEQLTRNIGLALIELIVLLFFYAPDLIYTVSNLLLKLPFSRRMELEADHIGLLLMAAAGYDPRVAPALYEKLWKLGGYPEVLQYLATHPSGKKRGENLRNTSTMEEAIRIYRDKIAGRTEYSGYLC